MPEAYWTRTRLQYRLICELIEQVDSAVSGITMLSFANNLFFVCIQLLRSIKLVFLKLSISNFPYGLYSYKHWYVRYPRQTSDRRWFRWIRIRLFTKACHESFQLHFVFMDRNLSPSITFAGIRTLLNVFYTDFFILAQCFGTVRNRSSLPAKCWATRKGN